jgi:hypothetical protein
MPNKHAQQAWSPVIPAVPPIGNNRELDQGAWVAQIAWIQIREQSQQAWLLLCSFLLRADEDSQLAHGPKLGHELRFQHENANPSSGSSFLQKRGPSSLGCSRSPSVLLTESGTVLAGCTVCSQLNSVQMSIAGELLDKLVS